jgi:hypothetical protein
VVRAKNPGSENLKFVAIKNLWFEIQVRSILEHAWAEIEHGVVYKPGIKFPKIVKRRFAALAGTLEILESEFLSLKRERNMLIDVYKARYRAGGNKDVQLDPARLVGLLEAEFPDNPGWRSGVPENTLLPVGSDVNCVDALKAVKIKTGRKLQGILRSPKFKQRLRKFSVDQMVQESALSHLSAVILVVASRSQKALRAFFPGTKLNI